MSESPETPGTVEHPPWLEAAWQAIAERQRQGRLPHGLMLHGPEGVGLEALTESIASALICEANQPGQPACGQCPSCQMMAAGTSSDRVRIECAADKREIPVDAIRKLIETMSLGRQRAAIRVVTLYPAERLNIASSNALLKTLEEPAADNLLLLVSHDPGRLMPTLRSRLQAIAVEVPGHADSMAWLARAHADYSRQRLALALVAARGAPLAAATLLNDGGVDHFAEMLGELSRLARRQTSASQLAESWAENLPLHLNWAAIWCHELLRVQHGQGRLNDSNDALQSLSARPARWLQDRYAEAIGMLRLARTPVSPQLLAERYLMGWH